jgi:hypothetical protein
MAIWITASERALIEAHPPPTTPRVVRKIWCPGGSVWFERSRFYSLRLLSNLPHMFFAGKPEVFAARAATGLEKLFNQKTSRVSRGLSRNVAKTKAGPEGL